MANDLGNKSLEQLGKEKIQAEINILEARLEKEFPDEKPPGRLGRLADFARKWSAFVLGSLTLTSAIIGVFLPLGQYLEEKRKALEYDLNENMIGFVDHLDSDSSALANRAVMMLSYYEVNSIPILLFFLEISEDDKIDFRRRIIETIDLIYSDERGNEIVGLIMVRMQNNLSQLKMRSDSDKEKVDSKKLMALYNFIGLIKVMELRSSDKKLVTKTYTEMKTTICADPFLRDDFDVMGVFYEICDFIGVKAECK